MVSRKMLIILVVIAIILLALTLKYGAFNLGKKVSTEPIISGDGSGEGKVSIEIIPPKVEDRLLKEGT